jgi:hypothetical protein
MIDQPDGVDAAIEQFDDTARSVSVTARNSRLGQTSNVTVVTASMPDTIDAPVSVVNPMSWPGPNRPT